MTDVMLLDDDGDIVLVTVDEDSSYYATSDFTVPIGVMSYSSTSVAACFGMDHRVLEAIHKAKSARFENGRIHEYSRQNAEPVQGW